MAAPVKIAETLLLPQPAACHEVESQELSPVAATPFLPQPGAVTGAVHGGCSFFPVSPKQLSSDDTSVKAACGRFHILPYQRDAGNRG